MATVLVLAVVATSLAGAAFLVFEEVMNGFYRTEPWHWSFAVRVAGGTIYIPAVCVIVYTMPRISMIIPDADLAAIDAVAEPNRTTFMVTAAREAVARIHRHRLELEVASCLEETAAEDRELAAEFDGTASDGL